MSATTYPGIDYSMGLANRDTDTGISFGVISMRELSSWFVNEDFEAIYSAYCPECQHEFGQDLPEENEEGALICPSCEKEFDSDDAWAEDADIFLHGSKDEEYFMHYGPDDSDVWIEKSPFFTLAQYCSPCAPGAGHLSHYCEEGPRTYCADPSMFDEEYSSCEYPMWRVDTEEKVYSFFDGYYTYIWNGAKWIKLAGSIG